MERIKEALERAREERVHTGKGFGGSSTPVALPTKGGDVVVDRIEYTQTRTIKVSSDFLREQRIVSGFEPGIVTDAYKILRTQVLQKMRENGW